MLRYWAGRLTKGAMLVGLAGLVAVAVANCQGADEEGQAAQSPADRRIEALSQDLELDEVQRERLVAARDLVHARRDEMRAERDEHAGELLDAIEAGDIDDERVHGLIDAKAEDMLATAHQVADELIAFVESLDQAQRERLVERLEVMHARMEAFHERMESGEGGHHQAIMRCMAEQGFSPPGWLASGEESR